MTPTVPKTQKAIVFDEVDGPLQYKEVPVPTPASNELLINVLYSGVCHSDLHAWHGDLPIPLKLPLIGGHEGAGIVVGMGSDVKGWKIGDRAGVKWLNKPCMICEQCELGNESMCPEAILSGFNKDGTFAPYCLADYIQAPKISPDVDLRGVAPLLCGGITVYKGLKAAQLKAGDWVVISGAGGGLGSMAVQYAKAMGLRVLGIDGGDAKKKAVMEIGAEAFVDFTKVKDIVAEVIKLTNGGAHGVLNVSVSEAAINLSPKYARPNGKVILLGLPKDAVLESSVFSQVVRSVTTRGSVVGNRADTREALGFYNRGLIKIPLHEGKLSDLAEIFKKMEKGDIVGRYVVDTSL